MSLHSSLKRSSSAGQHRNVLTRTERLAKLADEEKWREQENSIYGLPKVRSIKMRVKKKAKKKTEEELAAGEAAGAAGIAGAAGGAGAAEAAPGAPTGTQT
jgi:small basic protein (TIGR04137 family)